MLLHYSSRTVSLSIRGFYETFCSALSFVKFSTAASQFKNEHLHLALEQGDEETQILALDYLNEVVIKEFQRLRATWRTVRARRFYILLMRFLRLSLSSMFMYHFFSSFILLVEKYRKNQFMLLET